MSPPRWGGRRHRVALAVAGLGWYLPFAGAATVVLPSRIAVLDPVGKSTALGFTAGAGAIVGLVANVVFGVLSDRTVSRWGRRRPWILAGGLVGAGALATCAAAPSAGVLALSWCVYALGLNAFLAPLLATVADAVPAERRGIVSAGYGAGLLVGQVLGVVVGSAFLTAPGAGLVVLAAVFAVTGLLVVAGLPGTADPADPPAPPRPGRRRAFAAFGSVAFRWVFAGRILVFTVVSLVLGFQLYVLTDHVGLAPQRAQEVLARAGLLIGVVALVTTLVAGGLSDRFGRRRAPVAVAAGLLAVAATVPLVSPTTAGFLVFVGVAAAGYGAYQGVDTALMTEVLPSAGDRGRDLGMMNVATAGGQALGPLLAGVLVSAVGYAGVFATMAVLAAVAALTVLGVRTVR